MDDDFFEFIFEVRQLFIIIPYDAKIWGLLPNHPRLLGLTTEYIQL